MSSRAQIQRKKSETEPELRRQPEPAALAVARPVPALVASALSSEGQPLDRETRPAVEPALGHDFSQVRVHSDERAARSSGVASDALSRAGRPPMAKFAPPLPIQTRLAVNQPNDPYEQEAERIADTVIAISTPHAAPGHEHEPPQPASVPLQVARLEAARDDGQTPVSEPVGAAITELQGGGAPLPVEERAFFEQRFGHDFSRVRLHTTESAAQLSETLNARAFTVGESIVFGAGAYAPGTAEGRHLLAHELTHVLQQRDTHAPLPGLVPASAALAVQRKVAEEEGVCPVCGRVGKGTCQDCGQPFRPIQRRPIDKRPVVDLDGVVAERPAREADPEPFAPAVTDSPGPEASPAAAPSAVNTLPASMAPQPAQSSALGPPSPPADAAVRTELPPQRVATPAPAQPEAYADRATPPQQPLMQGMAEARPATVLRPLVTPAEGAVTPLSDTSEPGPIPIEPPAIIRPTSSTALPVPNQVSPKLQTLAEYAGGGSVGVNMPTLVGLPIEEAWSAAADYTVAVQAQAQAEAAAEGAALGPLPARAVPQPSEKPQPTAPRPNANPTSLPIESSATDAALAPPSLNTIVEHSGPPVTAEPGGRPTAATPLQESPRVPEGSHAGTAPLEQPAALEPPAHRPVLELPESSAARTEPPPTKEAAPATAEALTLTPAAAKGDHLPGEATTPDDLRRPRQPLRRFALPTVQRASLAETLMPDGVEQALEALRGEADTASGAIRSEGQATRSELGEVARSRGEEIEGDSQARAAQILGEGQARGGELEADGTAMSGELKAEQQEESGNLTATQQSMVGDLEAEGVQTVAELQEAQATRSDELEADAQAKDGELQADAKLQATALQSDAETAETDLRVEAEISAQSLQGDMASTEQEATALEAEVTQQAEADMGSLQGEADSVKADVAERWATLENNARDAVESLDAEAGDLCVTQRKKAQEYLDQVDPFIEDAQRSWEQLKDEAKAQWDSLISRAQPLLDAISAKWQEFSAWFGQEAWPWIKEKAAQIGSFIAERSAQAWDWMQQKWAWLSTSWANADQLIGAKAEQAHAWIDGRVAEAQARIGERADAAQEWVDSRASVARAWIGERAETALERVSAKAGAARAGIGERAEAAQARIGARAEAVRARIGAQAEAGSAWITGRSEAAQTWLTGKADASVGWFRSAGQGAISQASGRAREAVANISGRGGPIMRWFGGIVSSLISGLEGVGSWSVGVVSDVMGHGLTFVESKARGAVSFLGEASQHTLTFVGQTANSAVGLVQSAAEGAVNFVADTASGAVGAVATSVNGFVTLGQRAAESAVGAVHAVSDRTVRAVQGAAGRVVGWVGAGGHAVVTSVERSAKGAVAFVKGAWEGIKTYYGAQLVIAAKALSWLAEKGGQLAEVVNEHVIQPTSRWVQEQWSHLKGWVEKQFPGLIACWQSFQALAASVWEKFQQLPLIKGTVEAVAGIIEGALLGEVLTKPGLWNVVGMVIMGFIPYAGQAADVRDLIAVVVKLAQGKASWSDLLITAVAVIPGLDALKGAKGLNALDHADELADGLRALGRGLDQLPRELVEQLARHPEVAETLARHPEVAELILKYGDEGAALLAKHGDQGVRVLAEYGDEGVEMLRNGVYARAVSANGHEVTVLANGVVVRCSICRILGRMNGDELLDPNNGHILDELATDEGVLDEYPEFFVVDPAEEKAISDKLRAEKGGLQAQRDAIEDIKADLQETDEDISPYLTKGILPRRLEYMGSTPGKRSPTGQAVIDRMRAESPPRVRGVGPNEEVFVEGPDGVKAWYPISVTDMGHRQDAVKYWNDEGRHTGARSKAVRDWMKDPINYELEHQVVNRRKGSELGQTDSYKPPTR